MLSGGKKYQKVKKTKFRKNADRENSNKIDKQKHHDKSFYRLSKQETEYEL